MSRISQDPRLPIVGTIDYEKQLNFQLNRILREIATQLNLLTEGYIYAVTNAYTAAPTTGSWNRGDIIRNKEPSELGSAPNKYVITHWICTVSGSPGTWLQCRSLTGN